MLIVNGTDSSAPVVALRSPIASVFATTRSLKTEKKSCETSGGSTGPGLTPMRPPPTYWLAEMLSPQLLTLCGNVTW